ncbi:MULTISPECIES: TetR/AcrR family transcriptional regulator [unclassified Treponema]|uniref:TetR/AcrR family transcriptional regulator n=1 Tax=unclassified Treponema TaxID=2638727 RepID=UPI0020A38A83|nr:MULTISPECIES: TetR/AcrR family transcriptional regulator [unclassified Treponema]UTC67326.1 TetR/AcrR family transcriptional regulator [Treponema sp. OMZ 789]UTC70054.1 TetR/AcrR family transcriptional regulator [Treponema sp. OMZ 790]UTC72770.1 TetR/AcrR family transcriptional regulator [Treponema sp. OMZ 791]
MKEKFLTNKEELNTGAKILIAAKEEFFEKGFMGASVRSIANRAGLTTGAIYNLFKNKNGIFKALIQNVFEAMMKSLTHNPPPSEIEYNMKTSDLSVIIEVSRKRFLYMIDFFFENRDEMKLLVCCARGSSYEYMFDEAVKVMEKETIRWLEYDGVKITKRVKFFIHVMASSHFENLKEIFYHDLTKKEAIDYAMDFNTYHCAGWKYYWMEQVNS